MDFANEAARKRKHEYIGAEHIVLGLLENGDIADIFKSLGIAANTVRNDIEACMSLGPMPVERGKLTLTPMAKRTVERAMEEARPFQAGGRLADAGDILVGILVGNESAAAMVLAKHGLTADAVRVELQRLRNSQN
jgi:ATP-dependent Clp protease ATP-binding subunit ClpC